MDEERTYTAFAGDRQVASGPVEPVLRQAKAALETGEAARLLVFEDHSGRQVDFDWRGSADDVVARLAQHPLFAAPEAARTGPGRPKLGVVSREVTLLPRHWEWLEEQPSGASAALRRLVDDARKHEPGHQRGQRLRAVANRFMTAMAGNLAGYEEATRALFAADGPRLAACTQAWPPDLRNYVLRLVRAAEAYEATD